MPMVMGLAIWSFRKGSNVCRRSLTIMGSSPVWGGDEFIALLPIVGSEDIRRIKQEISSPSKRPCPLTVGPTWVEYPWALPAIPKQRTWMPCRNLLISGCTKIRKKRKKMQDLTYGYLATTEGN